MKEIICALIWVIWLTLVVGTPDILDGLIKRANQVECKP